MTMSYANRKKSELEISKLSREDKSLREIIELIFVNVKSAIETLTSRSRRRKASIKLQLAKNFLCIKFVWLRTSNWQSLLNANQ
jgi:hypothetical protein